MRERWADNVRGFAIYLVVLGHCIQYASHEGYDFADNIIFKLIYSFHMPLFMVLTGYLFWYTLSKYSLLNGIIAKIKGIMIPCMTWGLVTYITDIIINDYKPVSLYGYLNYTAYSNWFLWAVFYCSLIGFVSKYLFKSTLVGYVIILAANYFIPPVANIAGAKRLMPFFILGILLNQYQIPAKLKEVKIKILTFIILFVFYASAMLFTPDVELITGTAGSLLVCFIFWIVSKHCKLEILTKFGQVSIGIYVFTGIVFYFIIKDYCRITEAYRYAVRTGYIFVLSIFLMIISYLLCILLGKWKATSILFLGKDLKNRR